MSTIGGALQKFISDRIFGRLDSCSHNKDLSISHRQAYMLLSVSSFRRACTVKSATCVCDVPATLGRSPGLQSTVRCISKNSGIAQGLRAENSEPRRRNEARGQSPRSERDSRPRFASAISEDIKGVSRKDVQRVSRGIKGPRIVTHHVRDGSYGEGNGNVLAKATLARRDYDAKLSKPRSRPLTVAQERAKDRMQRAPLQRDTEDDRPRRPVRQHDTSRDTFRTARSPPARSDQHERDDASPTPSAIQKDIDQFHYDKHTPMSIPHTVAASQFIWGARAVQSSLTSARRRIYKLFLTHKPTEPKDALGPLRRSIRDVAHRATIPIQITTAPFIEQVIRQTAPPAARDQIHDGVMLEVSALPQPPITALAAVSRPAGAYDVILDAQSAEDAAVNGTATTRAYAISTPSPRRNPVLVWLHGVVDTRNVGALLRTTLFLGADAVLLTERATGSITAASVRASAGAAEVVDVLSVRDPRSFVEASQAHGWRFYAAVAPGAAARVAELADVEDGVAERHPCVLVVGNEDEGLPGWLVRLVSDRVTIAGSAVAGRHGVDSLNVSVAGGILLEKLLRDSRPIGQRREEEAASRAAVVAASKVEADVAASKRSARSGGARIF